MPAVLAQSRQLDSGQRTRADSGASFTPVIHKSPATASGPSYFFRLAGFGPLSGRIVLATWGVGCAKFKSANICSPAVYEFQFYAGESAVQ